MIQLAWVLVTLPLLLALYAYVLYPALLWLRGRDKRPVESAAGDFPLVTIVIPAYNEELQIRGAIEAMLAQDYPAERRQILILSDASSDATDSIVLEYESQGVELLRMPKRMGKTAAENVSTAHMRGVIVVNSDASVRLHHSSVRLLVAAMSDPTVGVASTRDVSVARVGGSLQISASAPEAGAEAGYVGYEMWIRTLETRTGGIVGASGSGYAIRSSLHRHPVREDLSRDFSAALTAKRHGFRAVAVESALCYVPRTSSLSKEYRRKVRTISRGMDTLFHNRDLLDPIRHGSFAWKLLSHKLSRWLVPLFCIPAMAGLVMLLPTHPLGAWLIGAGVLIAALALLGARWPDSRPIPGYLPPAILGGLAANLAVIHAWWRVFHGHEDHVWEPTRRAVSS